MSTRRDLRTGFREEWPPRFPFRTRLAIRRYLRTTKARTTVAESLDWMLSHQCFVLSSSVRIDGRSDLLNIRSSFAGIGGLEYDTRQLSYIRRKQHRWLLRVMDRKAFDSEVAA